MLYQVSFGWCNVYDSYIFHLLIAAGMGAVFGFFMGSLSQMSSPMMTGAAIQNPNVKPSVMKEVVTHFCSYL